MAIFYPTFELHRHRNIGYHRPHSKRFDTQHSTDRGLKVPDVKPDADGLSARRKSPGNEIEKAFMYVQSNRTVQLGLVAAGIFLYMRMRR